MYIQNVTNHANTCIQTTAGMPLRNRCRDDVVHGPAASTPSADIVIIISSIIFQLLHIMDPRAVDFLLKHTPDAVVRRIQIWRIRWPHHWRDKLWRLSLQHGASVTCTMCWCPILLKNVVISENKADIQQKHAYLAELYSGKVTVDLNPWFQEVQLRSTNTGRCHRNHQRLCSGVVV